MLNPLLLPSKLLSRIDFLRMKVILRFIDVISRSNIQNSLSFIFSSNYTLFIFQILRKNQMVIDQGENHLVIIPGKPLSCHMIFIVIFSFATQIRCSPAEAGGGEPLDVGEGLRGRLW